MTQTATTKSQGPRGWDRLVALLNAAPDLATFHRGMLDLQCKIVAAEYGMLWARDGEGKPVAVDAWPKALQAGSDGGPMLTILQQAAQSGFERGVSHILKAEPEGASESVDLGAHIFVTVLRLKGQVAAVTTVVAECRDTQVLQSTLPMRELAAGLYECFFARREVAEKEMVNHHIRQAMALLAVSQEGEGYNGACLNLVNELARQLKCTRVSLGWVRGRSVRLVAMSDTEHLKRHSEQAGLLELAQAECLDQQQPIVFPIPANAEPLLQQAVVHAHRRVTDNQPGRYVASLPLRFRDDWIGVITLERVDNPLDAELVQFLQLIVDVVGPHLYERREADRLLVGHAWRSVEKTSAFIIGPKHTIWKLGALVALAVLVFIVFGSWSYRVTAPFTVEAREKRFVATTDEGRVESVNVEPGDRVKAGDLLAKLDTRDLALRLSEAQAQLQQSQYKWAKAMGEGKMADAREAEAEVQKSKVRAHLLTDQIQRAELRAPIDGVVLNGYWKDKIGSVVKQGDQLFEIAPLDKIIAVISVADSDINEIDAHQKLTGEIKTKSQPEIGFPITVTRVVPMAQPVNNVNSFELRAAFDPPADDEAKRNLQWLRPGMEGLAKIEAGRRPIYWILSHKVVDTVRLWVWW